MRAIGYARVSSEDQVRGGVSLEMQDEKIRAYADLHDLDLLDVVADAGLSAKSLDRPGLIGVLARLDSGEAGTLVVFKLDRLTRSLGDWSHLIDRYFGEKGGKSLASVSESIDTSSAGGRLVLNVMMTVAQWERETIVERTRSAVRHKASKGERLGQIPYGMRLGADGRSLEPDPADASTFALILSLKADRLTTRRIADELNRRAIPAKRGGAWSHSSVAALLRRSSEASS